MIPLLALLTFSSAHAACAEVHPEPTLWPEGEVPLNTRLFVFFEPPAEPACARLPTAETRVRLASTMGAVIYEGLALGQAPSFMVSIGRGGLEEGRTYVASDLESDNEITWDVRHGAAPAIGVAPEPTFEATLHSTPETEADGPYVLELSITAEGEPLLPGHPALFCAYWDGWQANEPVACAPVHDGQSNARGLVAVQGNPGEVCVQGAWLNVAFQPGPMSEPICQLTAEPSSGCNTTPSPAWWALLLPGLLLTRRRGRSLAC